mmetsp:Transcript_22932/g.58558  ORF Transcript_22932/g.58558 Transcript_22932/m.58558 type:complete len:202 (-) Transcript_22932:1684-2289(-)
MVVKRHECIQPSKLHGGAAAARSGSGPRLRRPGPPLLRDAAVPAPENAQRLLADGRQHLVRAPLRLPPGGLALLGRPAATRPGRCCKDGRHTTLLRARCGHSRRLSRPQHGLPLALSCCRCVGLPLCTQLRLVGGDHRAGCRLQRPPPPRLHQQRLLDGAQAQRGGVAVARQVRALLSQQHAQARLRRGGGGQQVVAALQQ